MSTGLLGSPTPRVQHVPEYVSTYGDEAASVAKIGGLVLDEAQVYTLRAAMGETANGQWSAKRVAIFEPRQNGKTVTLMARLLWGLFVAGETVLWSAHLFKTSENTFTELKAIIDATPSFAKRVRSIRNANGGQSVIVDNGGSVHFIARSKNAGRGLSADLIVCDEAQELGQLALSALLPILSARPNGTIWYAGTTPDDARNDSSVFTGLRDAGRDGTDPKLCWLEWSASDTLEVDLSDRLLWALANPALGTRISEDTIAGERVAMTDEAFAQERLCIWPSGAASGIFGNGWGASLQPDSTITGTPTYGLAVSLDRAHASIGAAGRNQDGMAHLELIDRQRGTGWLIDRAVELQSKHGGLFVVDGIGPSASMIEPLKAAGVNVLIASRNDVATNAANVYDAVTAESPTVRHIGQPDLDAAVLGARKRDVGDGGWAVGRKNSTAAVDPLEAVLLAHIGLDQSADYDILQSAW